MAMGRWPLLGNRDYMLLWSGEILSELGSQVSTIAYPLLVLGLTHSPAEAGVVGLAKWLPLVLFALPAGALADRVDRKRLMIACDGLRMLAAASIVLALIVGRPAYLQVVVVAFLDGALFITSYICERGALRQVVPTEQVQDAVAQNEARTFAAGIVGPPLGGVLFAAARVLPFLVDTLSFLSSMTAIAATRVSFQGGRSTTGTTYADGFTWMWSRPFYRAASLLAGAVNPVYTGLYLLAILLARHDGASSAQVGVLFAIVGVGGVLGALAAAPLRRRIGTHALLCAQQWLLAGAVLLLLAVHSALLIGGLLAVAEFLTPAGNAAVGGARVAAAPDHLQGRVQASGTVIAMSFAWAGPLAAGLLFQRAGVTAAILSFAALTLALAVITTLAPALRAGPPARNEPTPCQPAAD
jgi:MFS family permease